MRFLRFLPWLEKSEPDVLGQEQGCGLEGAAARFEALWMALLAERAAQMTCDERLVAVAQAHADYLIGRSGSELEQSMHFGRGGSTPNQRVRAGGYRLLDWHGGGNTCECCVRASDDAAQALNILLGSAHHRPVILGEGFWEASVVYGVGQAGTDWVILVCPPE